MSDAQQNNMYQRVISTGFNTGAHDGDLKKLDERLAHMAEIGCTGAEITSVGLDAVVACKLISGQVSAIRQIMRAYSLAYSMHAPIAINLMDQDHAELMVKAGIVSMELAAEIGAEVVVLHPGRVHPVEWINHQSQLEQFELDQLGKVADRARALGIKIAYENISPNARVVSGEETSYSLDPRALAKQILRLNHPAVVACLDISHAQQGAVLWGFDMLEACAALAPLVGHIHFSDSTGIPATFPTGNRTEQQFFGAGDMHAPKGFGVVDFERLAGQLPVQKSTRIVIEIKKNFLQNNEAQTLQDAKDFAAQLNRAHP